MKSKTNSIFAPTALTTVTTAIAGSIALASTFTACTSARTSQSKDLVMVTAFEPFGKWNVNLSKSVADEIQKNLGDEVEVHVCTLPVVYDLAAQKAQDCYRKLPKKPAMVLSLGEGGCEIRLESAATNVDHAPKNADNAGVYRTMHTIAPGGPRRSGFSLPLEQMYCSLDEQSRPKVMLSISPGNYVCNNTSYHLSGYFKGEKIPYGFVHVPHSGCENAIKDPEANARIITQMLSAALAYKQSHAESLTAPTRAKEVQALLAGTSAKSPQSSDLACRVQFLKGLGQAYESVPKKSAIQF